MSYDFLTKLLHPDDPQIAGFPGPGWAPIVERLCRDLHATEAGMPRVIQIKQKLGGLRFYVEGLLTDEQEMFVNHACEQASKTCERCGDPGRLRQLPSNHQVLCDPCLKLGPKGFP